MTIAEKMARRHCELTAFRWSPDTQPAWEDYTLETQMLLIEVFEQLLREFNVNGRLPADWKPPKGDPWA